MNKLHIILDYPVNYIMSHIENKTLHLIIGILAPEIFAWRSRRKAAQERKMEKHERDRQANILAHGIELAARGELGGYVTSPDKGPEAVVHRVSIKASAVIVEQPGST